MHRWTICICLAVASGAAIPAQEKSCRNCGTSNRPAAKFCSKCGEKFAVGRVCPDCARESRGDAKQCEKCGRAFDVAPSPVRIEPVSWIHARLQTSANLARRPWGRLRAEPAIEDGKVATLQDGNFDNYLKLPSSSIVVELAGVAKVDGVALRFWSNPRLGKTVVEGRRGTGDVLRLAELADSGNAREGWLVVEFPAVELDRIQLAVESLGDCYLYEILVFEVATDRARSESLLSRCGLDLASSAADGCVFLPSEGVASARFLNDGSAATACALAGPFVLAFAGNGKALVRAVVVAAPVDGGKPAPQELPARIRISASTDDPLEGFRPVGEFAIRADEAFQRFEFEPVPARFLRWEPVLREGQKRARVGEIGVEEGWEPGYVGLLFRGANFTAERASAQPTLEQLCPDARFGAEVEPNDEPGTAQPAGDGWIRGSFESATDKDCFSFRLPGGEEQFPVLELHMLPFLRAAARILDRNGKVVRVFDLQKEGRGTTARIDLDLPEGEYRLELTSSPVYVLLSYDRSGSMGGTFATTRDAILRWSKQLPPGFRVALAGTNHDSSRFTVYAPFTDDPARIAEAAAKAFLDGGGDDWWSIIPPLLEYADQQAPANAVAAVVYLTDGVGTGDFRALWKGLRDSRVRLYTIGFGTVGREPLENDIGWIPRRGLFNIAWYRGGRYFEPGGLNELVETYDAIFDDLRRRPEYAFRIASRKRASGTLETGRPKGEDRPIHFVLDSSGSMMEKVGAQTRLDVAREVVEGIIGTLPDGARVGLRVYGHRYRTAGDEAELAAIDSELLIPVGPLDRSKFTKALRSLRARGGTPLAYSLLQAAGDLEKIKRPRVILITDGVESFQGDPVRAARDLSVLVPETSFAVVGFGIGRIADRDGLRAMARAGNGEYYDAEDAKTLVASIEKSIFPVIPFTLTDPRTGRTRKGSFGETLTLPEGRYALVVSVAGVERTVSVRIRPGESAKIEVPKP